MPTTDMQRPALLKPKSKIRLRLGLTPPHAKPATPTHDAFKHELSPVNQDVTLLTSISTATSVSDHNLTQSNLASSTTSNTSSACSGDAFAYDLSPASDNAVSHTTSPRPPALPNSPRLFDTISYSTRSPSSIRPTASSDTLTSGLPHGQESVQVHDQQQRELPTLAQTPSRWPYLGDAPHSAGEDLTITHPGILAQTTGSDNVFNLTDEQLDAQFDFIEEIGFGNWGSVWLARLQKRREPSWYSQADKVIRQLGKKAAAGGGVGAGGKVAIKVVHRQEDEVTATRVRALWAEMKIIRSLRFEPHPSIIQFEAFVICPSYALVIMPYHADLIPVCLPPARAIPYFRQLASAVGYLHERGITHNDIKPANILLSHSDVPVLIDFGFAQRWDTKADSRGMFLSVISWGTPEYLDPQRAIGMPHDERASDVWSLGVTFFELLMGRTPFELDNEEEFETEEEYLMYFERCKRGEWLGDWYMSDGLQHLIRSMVCPDPAYRISAMQAYHHSALQPTAPSVIITPHFVRAAASFDKSEVPPMPATAPPPSNKEKPAEEGKRKRKTKKRDDLPARTMTPTALGESIKQHTSMPRARPEQQKKGEENTMPSPKKVIARTRESDAMLVAKAGKTETITPTKVIKTAQSLRVQDLNLAADKRVSERTSQSSLTTTATIPTKDKRASILSSASSSNLRRTNKDDAVLKTMRSLEGTRVVNKDILSSISRPAPEPPRPKSLDSAEKAEQVREKKLEQRRSLGVLPGLKEESPVREGGKPIHNHNASPVSVARKAREHVGGPAALPSPPKPRVNTRPTRVVQDGKHFPGDDQPADGAVEEVRQRILSHDREKLVRFRQNSLELMKETAALVATGRETLGASTAGTRATEAASPTSPVSPAHALDSRLESLASWVQQMERLVTEARRAIAEGRDPPTLPTDMLTTLPADLSAHLTTSTSNGGEGAPEHRFGVTPDKQAIPAHLRTSSTQVEPATPPKWLTRREVMGETEKGEGKEAGKPVAGVELDRGAVRAKKERPTVPHVLKLFGSEKPERERDEKEKASGRSKTPEPILTVPLKAPALRGVPSTPALRSSFSSTRSRVPITRKSESNLRNFATAPTSSLVHSLQPLSPRRAVYEDLLDSTPGVTRKGDGWSSLSSGKDVLGKSSSMASLRRAFLGDRDRDRERERKIVDLADEVGKARERRPATPGATTLLGQTSKGEGKARGLGLFGRIKRGLGGK